MHPDFLVKVMAFLTRNLLLSAFDVRKADEILSEFLEKVDCNWILQKNLIFENKL